MNTPEEKKCECIEIGTSGVKDTYPCDLHGAPQSTLTTTRIFTIEQQVTTQLLSKLREKVAKLPYVIYDGNEFLLKREVI